MFKGVWEKIEIPLYRGRVCERYRGWVRDEVVLWKTGSEGMIAEGETVRNKA